MHRKLFSGLLALLLAFPVTQLLAADGYRRDANTDVHHYAFHLALHDSTDRVEGVAHIIVNLLHPSEYLELDLKNIGSDGKGMAVSGVEAGMDKLEYRHENDRLRIKMTGTAGTAGVHEIIVRYAGIPADGLIISTNRHGERTFFGDNWPDRARHWLPCVDHPSDKATVEFFVTAPERYQVVSNGLPVGMWTASSTSGKGYRVSHWRETVPLPTKVMVIGAASFAWETAGYSKGIPVQSWVFWQERQAGFDDYRPATGIMTFFQELIGPYSFEKLANVQSKTRFGGMENSGCIFYNERSVNGKANQVGLLAHEIAHQWFGDAVTEKDWHHIWLSEGFATYLEAVYSDSMLTDRDLGDNMAQMRNQVIRYYERSPRPVIDTTVTDLMNLLSTNSYQKGAWVLHMLRQELGDQSFWKGLRMFYDTYRNGNVMTSDFVTVMESVSGKPLKDFFHQWLEIAGHPVLDWTWKYDADQRQVVIEIDQVQDQLFTFNLTVELLPADPMNTDTTEGPSGYRRLAIQGRHTRFVLPVAGPVGGIRPDPFTQLLYAEKKAH